MKKFSSYRAAIRNAWRRNRVQHPETKADLGNAIRFWRLGQNATLANIKAKLQERAAQCYEARKYLTAAVVKAGFTGLRVSINSILREFWITQVRTRIVSRILRELAVPARAW